MKTSLRIAADANIPLVRDACAPLGDVTLFDSRDPARLRSLLAGTDVLLCRSTIRVGADLLARTPVRFVATATSGTDHVDIPWLADHGIAFASAAGSNARSVAEYVVAALMAQYAHAGKGIAGKSIGIIGAGHVGSIVAMMAEALGMRVVLNDPPLAEATGDPRYRSLEDALHCDVVTLHVPKTAGGAHPTVGLLSAPQLDTIADGAIILNTARGGVIDEAALLDRIHRGRLGGVVLDVHAAEPRVNRDLVAAATIATAHIAGHSHDGKLLGTRMVCDALRRWMGADGAWDGLARQAVLPAIHLPGDIFERGISATLDAVIRCAYDPMRDDATLRSWLAYDDTAFASAFTAFRATYPVRREFPAYRVRIPSQAVAASPLQALGFHLIPDE